MGTDLPSGNRPKWERTCLVGTGLSGNRPKWERTCLVETAYSAGQPAERDDPAGVERRPDLAARATAAAADVRRSVARAPPAARRTDCMHARMMGRE